MLSIFGFAAERDRMYVVFASIVLVILLYSLFGTHYERPELGNSERKKCRRSKRFMAARKPWSRRRQTRIVCRIPAPDKRY